MLIYFDFLFNGYLLWFINEKWEYILCICYENMYVLYENNKEDFFKYVFELEYEYLLNL